MRSRSQYKYSDTSKSFKNKPVWQQKLFGQNKEIQSDTYKMFIKYGHDCTLEDLTDDYEWDFAAGFSLRARLKRWWARMIVVSETSKFYTHHLRSFGAIVAERKRHLRNYPWIIHPFSKGRVVWAGIMLTVIMCQFIVTPLLYIHFDFRFKKHRFPLFLNVFRLIFDSFLISNVIINCVTGYYDEPMQRVVLDCKSIMKHYLRNNLILDFLSALPTYLDIFVDLSIDSMAIILWITLFRFLLFRSFTSYSKVVACYFHMNHFKYLTTMVILNTLFFWHIMCCIVEFIRCNIIYVKRFEAFFDESKEGYLIHDDFWEKFVNTLHHISLLLYNAGYGKSVPKTEYEVVLIYVVWYGSSLFCIYILGKYIKIIRVFLG